MPPQLDEDQADLVSEVQDLARLHVDLARAEVRDGTRRLQRGVALLLLAFASAGLLVLSAGITLFLWLQTHFVPWISAALTTVALVGVLALTTVLGKWQLRGTRALLLPRSRALLGELFSWKADKPTNS